MEKPAEGFGKIEPEWIDEIKEEHVGKTYKYYSDDGDSFSYYIRILLVRKDKFWFELKERLTAETWETSGYAYPCQRAGYKAIELPSYEANPKLHIVEEDVGSIFSCYHAYGGRHQYHLKIIHVYDDLFWAAQWDIGSRRWTIEKTVRSNADSDLVYEKETAISWSILEASPWSQTAYATKCPTCGADWCETCSTEEEYVCCTEDDKGCGKRVPKKKE